MRAAKSTAPITEAKPAQLVTKDAPRPRQPVRGPQTGEPIKALLYLLGRRWALRIIWELRASPFTFRELQARCDGMSASVLNQRLGELRDADILDSGPRGFVLTGEGHKLLDAYPPLQAWAQRWAQRTRDEKR